MSDDIDRLKTVLENLAQVNDELKDIHDATRDVVNSVKPVELETDAEGHAVLRDIAGDIRLAFTQLHAHVGNLDALVWKLMVKARVRT